MVKACNQILVAVTLVGMAEALTLGAKAGVDPERLFIVEPKSLAPEKNEKFRDSRVDFKIS